MKGKEYKASTASLTPEMFEAAIENLKSVSIEIPAHLVSPDRYRNLKYLVGEILKIDPNFYPSDPWSIEAKADSLSIKLPKGTP